MRSDLKENVTHIIAETPLYGPGALLHAFGNSLTSPVLNKVMAIKGVYRKGKGVNYNGLYYDILKDEFSEANITLLVPEALRSSISEGQLIEGAAYLSKRFTASTGRIDLLLHLTEVASRKEATISDEQIHTLQLIQQKARAGYRNVDYLIKTKLYKQSPISVVMLIGMTAIIDNDIRHQLRDAVSAYDISYVKVNLTRPSEIIEAMKLHDGCDILVVTRGGGENIQIFDNLYIGEQSLNLRSCFITAIGHAADEPLLQKLADKSFITPTALGQYFYDLYHHSAEELSNSKAQLISDLTKQIELQFQAKIQNLNTRLVETTELAQVSKQEGDRRSQELNHQLARSKTVNGAVITLLVLLMIAAGVYFFAI